jgi:RNA polymerase sigma factor (TIGR02999 family)
MADITHLLSRIEQGDASAAEQLLPLVYDELRKLAAVKMAAEKPGQTLQSTALVHEAYLRLVGGDSAQRWDSRGHFFSTAAEALRRILVDRAKAKASCVSDLGVLGVLGGEIRRNRLASIGNTWSCSAGSLPSL